MAFFFCPTTHALHVRRAVGGAQHKPVRACRYRVRPKQRAMVVKAASSAYDNDVQLPTRGPTSAMPDEDLVVVALGGNALMRRGQKLSDDLQRENVRGAAKVLAQLVRAGYRIVVTHGNGPQVGYLALALPESKFDLLDAETEGWIGYLIESELTDMLDSDPKVVTLLTQVIVNHEDEAFKSPTKFVGPQYDEDKAKTLSEAGFTLKKDGDKYRRVVASPQPLGIVESEAIRVLLKAGLVVVCGGGGGVPVCIHGHTRHGMDAVVDKDASSRVLGSLVSAKYLLMLTDAEGVFRPDEFGKEGAKPIQKASAEDLDNRLKDFPAGSMQPKIKAAIDFTYAVPGGVAAIGPLADALDVLQGKKGTTIEATGPTEHGL